MPKRIFLTKDEIADQIEQAKTELENKSKSLMFRKFQSDDKETITVSVSPAEVKSAPFASVLFTPNAWVKMQILVQKFSGEVGWHGTISRIKGEVFLVDDIVVFPQIVTSTTVTPEYKAYDEWYSGLGEDTQNLLHFHGHSHVNMAVNPSSVDMEYRKNILNNFGRPGKDTDYFYVFLITNKRGEISGEIYDIQNNLLYANTATEKEFEVDVINNDGERLNDFLEEANSLVKSYTPPESTQEEKKRGGVGTPFDKKLEQNRVYGYETYCDGYDDEYCEELYERYGR